MSQPQTNKSAHNNCGGVFVACTSNACFVGN